MINTININSPLRWKWKDQELEKEYSKITDNISFKFYIVTFAMLILAAVCIAIILFRVGKAAGGIALSCLAVALLLILWKRQKIKKLLAFIAFVIGLGLFVTGVIFIEMYMNTMEPTSIFFQGYAFGMFALLLQQLFHSHQIKFLIMVASMISRYAIMIPETYIGWTICLPFDFANIIILIYLEKSSRTTFEAFFNYRNELTKFKTLLNNHFPENIAIIHKNLKETAFINESFTKNFRVEAFPQLLNLFSRLKVNMDTFNQGKELGSTSTFLTLQNPTLSDFLKHCVEDIIKYRQIIFFNVQGYDEQGTRLNYGVKVFHLKWDGSDTIVTMLNDLAQQETILALKLADENKDKVLQTVSHELRTPINGMLGAINLIAEEFTDPKLLAYCKTAKICSKMLLNLVNSILDLSQIRNNCIKLNPTVFNLEDMLDEVESIFIPQCITKKLGFEIRLDPELEPKIMSDYNRLSQVVINLLANAMKFTFEGEILVKINKGKNRNEIEFSIQDTGTGIKLEDKPKLFKMFGRLDQPDAGINTQGVGLGLTISNSLVKLLNPKNDDAKIDFESAPGKGTTFFFTVSSKLSDDLEVRETEEPLPTKTERNTHYTKENSACYSESIAEFNSGEYSSRYALITSPHLATSPRLFTSPNMLASSDENYNMLTKYKSFRASKRGFESPTKRELQENSHFELRSTRESSSSSGTVLIVDDMAVNLFVASALLGKRGFNVITAFNGQDAIEKVKSQDRNSFFKMILMDCQMPVMDGYQATSILKEMMEKEEIPEVPIFALTANDTKKDQEECLKAGMSAFLVKPLKEADLQKVMDEYLK